MKKLSYLSVIWGLVCSEALEAFIFPFLEDYFKPLETEEKCHFIVELLEEHSPEIGTILEKGERISIHSSDKPAFNEQGFYLDKGYVRYVYNQLTKSVYIVNYFTNNIKILNKDISMLSRDGIRITRDFVKVMIEKETGAIMYHASAVMNSNNEGIIFMGDKGKGKTTLSLNLIYDYGYSEVSRDRIYLQEQEGKFTVYGWPTYYNLTYKTIKNFERTTQLFPADYAEIDDATLGRIQSKLQLLPSQIGVDRRVSSSPLTYLIVLLNKNESADLQDIIALNCFTPQDTYSMNWHGLQQDKQMSFSNCLTMFDRLKAFPNILFLEVDEDIQTTIAKLFELIESNK